MVSPGSSCGRQPISLLYADPDSTDRSRTVRELESRGAVRDVETVSTVDEIRTAIEDGNSSEYACLVAEYRLDGADVTSLASELPTDRVPVVVFTDDGDEMVAGDVIAAGASGYVSKDCSKPVDRLLEQVRAAVDDVRERQRLETIHDAALEFVTCETVAEAYQLAVETADRLAGGESSGLFVTDQSRGATDDFDPELVAVAGSSGDSVRADLAARVARTGTFERIDDAPSSTEGRDEPALGVRSVLAVPVDAVGVLQSTSRTRESFDDADRRRFEQLATHLASTVERIQSKRALRAERDRFAALFESVPDAIALTTDGERGRILDVNPAFEDCFGYDRSELVGESVEDLIVPDDGEPIAVADGDGLESGVSAEVERRTRDGRREFLIRGVGVEVGNERREYDIYTDITERKRYERELERYRTLVETVGDPMYILDADGRIEMINDAMADSLGDTRESIVGSHAREYMPDEDVEAGAALLADLLEDESRRWGAFEMTIEPADGDPYIAEDNLAPLVDEDGSLAGSAGVIRDISDRKERERRIRRLHDGTRRLMAAEASEEVAAVATEIAHDALDLPLNAIHLYDGDAGGLVPAAVTQPTRDLLDAVPTIEPDGGIVWEAYEAGEPIAHGDVRRDPNARNPETPFRSEVYIPLGEHGVFIVSSTEPNEFDREALTLAQILAANVEAALERALRETELAERGRELERQNERLEQFAETVSHDLRNPLTLAMGHLEALEVDEDSTRHVAEVEWSLERMDELIENVLTLARSGKRLADTEPVDVAAVVDRAHRTVDPDLEIVRDGALPTVEADDDRLSVLFENAFRNALEHVGEDARVTVTGTDDGFAIADDGPGIPPDEREVIFESGYSTAEDGTGFGLAIVSEVVEAHGWSIAAEASDDAGLRLVVSCEE